MKATNIFQSLKSSGKYNTDGLKPGLPGLSSPLDKKLVGDQKNLPQELKDKIEAAPESPMNYGSAIKKLDGTPKKEVSATHITTDLKNMTRTRHFSKEDQEKHGVPAQIESKITQVGKKPSPTTKKGCKYKK